MPFTLEVADATPYFTQDRLLRAPRIRVEESLPVLGAGVQKRATVGRARGIHQAVDGPETLQGRGDKAITVFWNRDVGLHKEALRP